MVNIKSVIDEDTGLIITRIGNWSGIALEFEKTIIKKIEKNKYLEYSGVYILLGPGEKNFLFQMYVGETDGILERIKQHDISKKFWNKAVIFTTTDNSLDKGSTLHLEHLIISKIKETKHIKLVNRNFPKIGAMETYRRKEIEEFFSKMYLILKNRGYFEHFSVRKDTTIIVEGKQIQIELEAKLTADEPSWKKYTLIPVLRKDRLIFPKYKDSFILETDIGEIKTHVTSIGREEDLQNLETAGKYIHKGMGKWFKSHPDLQPGDIIIITETDPKKRYKLEIKKSEKSK